MLVLQDSLYFKLLQHIHAECNTNKRSYKNTQIQKFKNMKDKKKTRNNRTKAVLCLHHVQIGEGKFENVRSITIIQS